MNKLYVKECNLKNKPETLYEFYKLIYKDNYKFSPSIDRIDNNGNYSKENCRWVAMSVQCTNKRNNVRYELNGKNLTLSEWEKETGVGRATIHKRVMRGVPLDQAITFKGYLKSGIS